ncbi:MAG: hypothetical protein ABIW16_01605 [Sphingomicrobium sp.]
MSTQRTVELIGCMLVVAGFAELTRIFFKIGYLPAPFVFDVGDTFMDWFNTAYWSHNPGAYSVWQTIYLPLSFIIIRILGDPRCYGTHPYDARDCDVVGIVAIVLIYLACVIVSATAFYRRDRSTALFRSVGIAFGGPLLFALERGNLIMVAYIAFVLLYGGLLKSRNSLALAGGVLVNMKVYLLFPIFAFAIKRNWRTFELCGIAAIAIYLASIVIVGAGTPFELARNLEAWFNLRAGTVWDEILYSTTYKPYLLLDERQYPIRDYIEQRWVDIVKAFVTYEVIASRAVAILCIGWAWFYPKAVPMNRLIFFILMQSFIVQNPGGYAITFLLFVVFLEPWKNGATATAIVCAYLMCIPTDMTITPIVEITREAWLSQRTVNNVYALPFGALVRPGILLVMLWSLAIDTLRDLHRATKAGPPSFGLSLRQSRAPQPASPAPLAYV